MILTIAFGAIATIICSLPAFAAGEPVHNGRYLNGLELNAMTFNGVQLNAMSFNGVQLNALSRNGRQVNAIGYNAMSWNGVHLDDKADEVRPVVLAVTLSDGTLIDLR